MCGQLGQSTSLSLVDFLLMSWGGTGVLTYHSFICVVRSFYQTVKIHPSSVLHSKKALAIIYDEIVHTKATYARNVSSIHYSWLAEQSSFNQRAV